MQVFGKMGVVELVKWVKCGVLFVLGEGLLRCYSLGVLRVVDITLVGLCFVSGIYGAEWVLMGVVLLWRSGCSVGRCVL